jgi:hypothetical protein
MEHALLAWKIATTLRKGANQALGAIGLPAREFCDVPYRYRVCNGYHRFYASIAAGFIMLPLKL